MEKITIGDFTRVNSDINGNPRYVLHYLKLDANYRNALNAAKKLGGKVYRASWYGGGIVFQSYNLHSLVEKLNSRLGDSARN